MERITISKQKGSLAAKARFGRRQAIGCLMMALRGSSVILIGKFGPFLLAQIKDLILIKLDLYSRVVMGQKFQERENKLQAWRDGHHKKEKEDLKVVLVETVLKQKLDLMVFEVSRAGQVCGTREIARVEVIMKRIPMSASTRSSRKKLRKGRKRLKINSKKGKVKGRKKRGQMLRTLLMMPRNSGGKMPKILTRNRKK